MLAFIARSVRRKTMAVILATTVAALLVNAAALLIYDFLRYRDVQFREARTQAEILGRAMASAIAFNDRKEAQAGLASLRTRGDFIAAALYTPDGSLFAELGRDADGLRLLPRRGAGVPDTREGDLISVSHDIIEGGQRLGSVRLVTRSELRNRVAAYVVILLAVMGLALGAALLMSAWLQRVLTGPILDIDATARRVVEQRDFAQRARKTSDDEIGILADAFNRMLDEVQQRQAELHALDRRKDEFLATLAHELRNPLAPILNSLHMMKASPADAGTQAARDIIERQVRQMVRLVDDLLDISRITSGKLVLQRDRVDLAAVARNAVEAVEPLARARNIRLNLELPAPSVAVHADATRLAQVFLNLLNNAIKFSERGGTVDFGCRVEAGEVVVTVRDRGIGIRPEQMESIFEMFVQGDASLERRAGGLGVGLALARYLVELHGGRLSAQSAGPGEGAVFVVRLPVGTQEALALDAGAPDPKPARSARQRVLVVDDNRDFALSLAAVLRALGHEVRVEHDGLAGLAAAEDFRPDVAFLDIGMPGLNGFDLAQRLKALPQTRHSMLIAVTGYGQPADRKRGLEAGFDLYLVKPLEVERLRDILEGGRPSLQSRLH